MKETSLREEECPRQGKMRTSSLEKNVQYLSVDKQHLSEQAFQYWNFALGDLEKMLIYDNLSWTKKEWRRLSINHCLFLFIFLNIRNQFFKNWCVFLEEKCGAEDSSTHWNFKLINIKIILFYRLQAGGTVQTAMEF